MQAIGNYDKSDRQAPPAPLHCSLTITGAGLMLGGGTVLARVTHEAPLRLAIDGEEERILALLSAALGKSVPLQTIENLRRASEQWSRGDKCLAHIHLAHAALPKVDEDAATRLALAEEALAKGVAPRALFKALGLDSASFDALKFNPDQPRVPAGSGRESGRCTSDRAGGPDGVEGDIVLVSNDKERSYEERRARGEESPQEDIEHGRGIPLLS